MRPGPSMSPHPRANDSAATLWTQGFTLIMAMAGAFCCPMAWSVFAGYLSISDAFFLAALAGHARFDGRILGDVSGLPWLLASALLFACSGLIVWATGDMHAEPINAAKLIFSMTVFPLLLVLTVGTDLRRLNWVLLAWMAGGAFSAGVAVASRSGISLLGFHDPTAASGGRALGLAYHPNVLGYTCALIAPVALYMAIHHRRWMMKWIALVALATLIYGLHLSGSRASVLALGLGAAYPVLSSLLGRQSPLILTATFGLAGALALMYAILGEFDTVMSDAFRESAIGRALGLSSTVAGSNYERRLYMEFAWEQFQENPIFGAGYGWLRGAHVHVLAILHSGGLLGFSAFLCWGMAVLLTCRRIAVGLGAAAAVSGRELWPVIVAGLLIWVINGALQPVLPDRNGYILIAALFTLEAHARRGRTLSLQLAAQDPGAALLGSGADVRGAATGRSR